MPNVSRTFQLRIVELQGALPVKLTIFISLFVTFASTAYAQHSLGVTSLTVTAEDQDRPLNLSLWYPGSNGAQEDVGSNAVFNGVLAGRDASPIEQKFPVVFVSHGGLRSASNSGAWLSAGLASEGYIAVEINAPRPSALTAVNEIWQRSNDISRAVSAILGNPTWSERIDRESISVVGFALGGTAALALAGGNLDPLTYTQSCDAPARGPDCGWYQSQNVTLDSVDRYELNTLRRDTRISSAVAISPEFPDAFSGGLSALDAPTLFVSLGSELDHETSLMTASFPDANVFDGFQTCTRAGPTILAADGGDPALCGTSMEARQQTHDAIIRDVAAFLGDLQ
jgi:predicted dienelactone hydrolase